MEDDLQKCVLKLGGFGFPWIYIFLAAHIKNCVCMPNVKANDGLINVSKNIYKNSKQRIF